MTAAAPKQVENTGQRVDTRAGQTAAARYNPSDAMIERIHHPRMPRLPRLIRVTTDLTNHG